MTTILPSVFRDGTATVDNGGVVVTGQSTLWGSSTQPGGGQSILPGDFFGVHKGFAVRIASVDSETQLTLANPWPGASQTAAAYEIMLQSDIARMQATSRALLMQLSNGNVYALTGLTGAANKVPIFTGPGAMALVDKTDLTSGVAYDVQVPNLAARAPYDTRPTGYAVLVSDVGDGRSALYTKASNLSADWSAPAYITGPVGPLPIISAGTTTTLNPGSSATVSVDPITDGYAISIGVPSGRGFTYRGAYNPATAYILDDGVLYQGSSWIAIAPTTGHAPPNLPTQSNAWWALYAIKGTDGTGIGDMVKSTYDPQNIAADAFLRSNHTGAQAISTVTGLQSALDAVPPAIAAAVSVASRSDANGRLTPSSGVVVPSSDVLAAGSLFFTPEKGNRLGLYVSGEWATANFSETAFSLAGLAASKLYDLFGYVNAGVLAIEASPAWTSDILRSTNLALQDGILVKSGDPTRRYLGTFYTSAAAQTEDSLAKRLVWNMYNRVARPMSVFESTDTWTQSTDVYRVARNSAANRLEFVRGLNSDVMEASVSGIALGPSTTQSRFNVAIGIDGTALSGTGGLSNGTSISYNQAIAFYSGQPGLGRHVANWLERVSSAGWTWSGDGGSDDRQSGILGSVFA